MTKFDQIYHAVSALAVADRLRLVERVVHDVVEAKELPSTTDEGSLIGLFADEPDLIDEVCSMARRDRESRPLRASDG